MSVVSSRGGRTTPSMVRVVPPSLNSKEVHVGRSIAKPGSREIVCRKSG